MYPIIFHGENIQKLTEPAKFGMNGQAPGRLFKRMYLYLCMKQPKTQNCMRPKKNDILLPHIFSASASLKAMPLQYIYLPDE